MQPYIVKAIEQHNLTLGFNNTIKQWYQPLAIKIVAKYHCQSTPLIVGIQGTQGSGKSTLADFLQLILSHEHNLRCAVISIDDFYLTHQQRQKMAKTIHPLFKTRGVPGTHDVTLAQQTLTKLSKLQMNKTMVLPRFDKAIDNPAPIKDWPLVKGPVDIIILEGWCIGLQSQASEMLIEPVNRLETEEDPEAIWRSYVNKQLAGPYQALFDRLDCLVVLQAPSFSCVFEWRLLQEKKLAKKLKEGSCSNMPLKLLTAPQIERFVNHFQRLTEYALEESPKTADWIISLDRNHNIVSLRGKQQGQ